MPQCHYIRGFHHHSAEVTLRNAGVTSVVRRFIVCFHTLDSNGIVILQDLLISEKEDAMGLPIRIHREVSISVPVQ
jgi:hypothetical protein